MATTLVDRLAKLHADAQCCLDDFRSAREEIIAEPQFVDALGVLNALGDEKRLSIVMLVQRYGELCACEIEAAFELSHSTVMHHVNLLTKAGLLSSRKDGRWTHYRMAEEVPAAMEAIVAFIGEPNREAVACCSCDTC